MLLHDKKIKNGIRIAVESTLEIAIVEKKTLS